MELKNRFDFVMLFDVENGNPNGDPDFGNSPRIDFETGHGFVTDVCLKRKIRNYIQLAKAGEKGFDILIKTDKPINTKLTEAHEAVGNALGKNAGRSDTDVLKARDYMCANYFDVRAFGAVMSTGDNPCGIVRGPVQINFARSLSPVTPRDITITRQSRTTEDRQKTGETEIGKKSIIPYGLYRAEGYVSAALANSVTKLSEEDVELLWQAIINMFEEDHSAARGKMCMRALYVFKHDSVIGNYPSHLLFEKIKAETKIDVPRAFGDYEISVDRQMPAGVELICKL